MVLQRPQRPHKTRRSMSEINVVPYIDVMLVLLIIFMITAPMLSQGVKVNLPSAQAKALDVKQNTPIIVSVDADGQYYLNVSDEPASPISTDDLLTRIAAEIAINNERPVLVKGDRSVSYGRVVQAMVLMQRAGVQEVGLMTSSEPEIIDPRKRNA